MNYTYPAPDPSTAVVAKRKWYQKKRFLIPTLSVAGLVLVISATSEEDVDPTAQSERNTVSQEQAADNAPEPAVEEPVAEEAPEPEPQITVAQEQAIQSAESYIELTGFSKAGLIDQLTSEYGEGFEEADARFAVNHIDVNWKQEAVEAAQGYMEMGGFSRDGLIDQLTSEYGEQFTQAQAVYAVNQVGL